MLANIRHETRIAALFPHTSVFPLPAFTRPISSRRRARPCARDYIRARMYPLCIHTCLAREARGLDPSGELYEKEERATGEEERKVRSTKWKKVERTTRHNSRVEEKGMRWLRRKRDTGTLVTSLSWSLVATGLSDDRIAVGRRFSVCQRGKGV